MLFNSLDFAVFLPLAFILYWFVFNRSFKLQNTFIVFASYVFYGWWDYRFLGLIFLSSVVDYSLGLLMANTEKQNHRKTFLVLSILVNLGILCFFKYFNFFIENFSNAFSIFGMQLQTNTLNIILPVGISFYTFQTLSYSIDIYRQKLSPTKDFIAFSAFVSFFPQLVAGPIERATNLLPQFFKQRQFDYPKAVDGAKQILWGLFKKLVIADNAAVFANMAFSESDTYSGSTLALGAIFFAFQIYGDFSGYSDIAIGTSRLFGFNLMKNFSYPYFSRDIAEFWRRWHISLSTWFRDYIYIPLGGSKGGVQAKVINTFIIFIISGFWHGANWTFIAWGALNALYFLPLLLLGKNRRNLDIVASGKFFPSIRELSGMVITFSLTVIAWVFFRADNISHAISYLNRMFSLSVLSFPEFKDLYRAYTTLALISIFMLVEWMGRQEEYAIASLGITKPRLVRWSFYSFILFIIGMFMHSSETPFIYFQF
jgi:alginate O-acetyltransferase complex protein AlgI